MKLYKFIVKFRWQNNPIEAIFRFEIWANTENQAYIVAQEMESQMIRDNPWFKDAVSTVLRRV